MLLNSCKFFHVEMFLSTNAQDSLLMWVQINANLFHSCWLDLAIISNWFRSLHHKVFNFSHFHCKNDVYKYDLLLATGDWSNLAFKTYSAALKYKFYFCDNLNVFNWVKAACGTAVVNVGCDVMIKSLLLLIFLIMICCFDLNRRSKSDSTSNCASTVNTAFEKQ